MALVLILSLLSRDVGGCQIGKIVVSDEGGDFVCQTWCGMDFIEEIQRAEILRAFAWLSHFELDCFIACKGLIKIGVHQSLKKQYFLID